MKKIIVLVSVVLVVAGVAGAANLPSGVLGLWLFNDATNVGKATVGTELTTNTTALTGGPDGTALNTWPGTWAEYQGGMTANGGGDYVNQYTVAMDITCVTSTGFPNYGWYSLLQTAESPTANSGDIWIGPDGSVGDGYLGNGDSSAPGVIIQNTNANPWYRVVLAADLGNYFNIYVNGTKVFSLTDGSSDNGDMSVDGQLSLYTDSVSFFASNDGYDGPVICDSLALWNRTLSDAEIASMGDISNPMRAVPEPATISILAIGGLALLRRNRK